MATHYRRSGYQHDPEWAYLRYEERKRKEAAKAARAALEQRVAERAATHVHQFDDLDGAEDDQDGS